MFTHTYKNHIIHLRRGYSGWGITVYYAPSGYTLPMSLQYRTNERGDFVKDLQNWRSNAERSIDMRLAALDDIFGADEPPSDDYPAIGDGFTEEWQPSQLAQDFVAGKDPYGLWN